ncbi:MAG: Ig-like domain-containing protein [Planctomycetota bacterium]|jgi:hypothetical protein
MWATRLKLSRTIRAFVVFAFVAGGLLTTVSAAERRPGARSLARAIQMQRRNTDRLLSIQDVVGTATGVAPDGRFVVKVYARRAGVGGIPKSLDGVPVVVEATGEFFALQRRWHRRPPPRRRDRRPEVMIVSPADGDSVSDVVDVTALASDDKGVTEVTLSVNGNLLESDTDGSDGWTFAWDTIQVEDGYHQVTATAADTVGQRAAHSVGVVVDNEPGPFSPDGRPAPIGVSTGNENECAAGTIACRVVDAQGNVYALSNNHVYARLNLAELGEAVLQPGLIDTDCTRLYSDQVIGYLADYVPIGFRWRGDNLVDAAIALSSPDDLEKGTPFDGYGVPKSVPVEAYVDQPVQKYGHTSLLTTGHVSGIEATVVVNYGFRSARFSSQIIVDGAEGFIEAGDSGSLLVTYDPDLPELGGRDPVGLLYAGSEDGSMAIASPIQAVLDEFEVTIDGE